ncbi:unnamed protein product [Bursaphelenchus xylophilus]|uniref:POU domain protein n=1 Tax=Bursaphelenchus xylophilus TaxID=6326 RepID=A0A7I8WHP2_BURXY|nr:unnamed protein product [Bursaphelenchus xylophilus]CAG9109523.1 unnamed protein product [Bursaphelenchus xylophilus]
MNSSQRIYPGLNSMGSNDRYSPTPYRQRMQQTNSIFGALDDPFFQTRVAQAAQAQLAEIDVKNVNMNTNMFSYQGQNLLNSSNHDLVDNSSLGVNSSNASTNLLDTQSQGGNDAMSPLQQVMAMQHHYGPGGSGTFSPYHQLPQASVANVAAAFGQHHGGPMNIMNNTNFVGNPLNGVPNNSLLPRYSLSHADFLAVPEIDTDPRELERFAEHFKQRRIKLGVTQADVGKALAHLKMPGVGSLSQSTICRFESLTLSHNNMVALKPILQTWLEKAEDAIKNKTTTPDVMGILPNSDKKRKRTSIAAPEKRLLEDYFRQQPRPTGDRISAIAEKLDLKKNVVRVWFCNQRQKQKRNQLATNGIGGSINCQNESKYTPNLVDLKSGLLPEEFLQSVHSGNLENMNNNGL